GGGRWGGGGGGGGVDGGDGGGDCRRRLRGVAAQLRGRRRRAHDASVGHCRRWPGGAAMTGPAPRVRPALLAAEPGGGRRRGARRRVGLRSSGGVRGLAVAVTWQLAALALHRPTLPTFPTALAAVGQVVTGPALTADILPSLARTLIAFAIAGAAGVIVGLTLGYVRSLGDYAVAVIDF